MTTDFADRVVLVTGAGSGIGRAAALAFARSGARVAAADISVAGGEETVELIREAGGQASFLRTDVADRAAVEAMVAHTVEAFGRLDCAFNNAGIEHELVRMADCDEAVFDKVVGVNLAGVYLCMKYEIRQMLKQGGGAIVNTASVAGLAAAPKFSAYGASKHGVVGLTRSAAVEYARHGIRINAVCPGVIRTPMLERLQEDPKEKAALQALHPIGRLGEPEEVAAAVLWLCSPQASFIVGHALPVDGGYTAV